MMWRWTKDTALQPVERMALVRRNPMPSGRGGCQSVDDCVGRKRGLKT
jgi:hypothetical protein